MKRLKYRYYLKPSNKLLPASRINKEPVWVRVSLPSCKIDGKSKFEYQYINLGVDVKPKYFGQAILDESKKLNKVRNLIYAMSKKDNTIINKGTTRNPIWKKV